MKNETIGRFFCDYAALLLRSGSTCLRLEKNVQRIADAWGVQAALTIMSQHVHVSVTDSKGNSENFVVAIGKNSISFEIVSLLSRLSWDIADGKWELSKAYESYEAIQSVSPANRWWVLLVVSCANAAFCRLFGGDVVAMAVVFVATMSGYYLKQLLLAKKIDLRLVFMVCAFVSAVLASADKLFLLGQTSDIAIATSVLYLVPGVPLLNAFSDMIDGHYISFLSRMTDALILTACLSMGLCAGMSLMNIGMF